MPKYFFNVNNTRPVTDDEGEELPNKEAAWHEATAIAGEIFKDMADRFSPGQEWCLEVADERRKPLYNIRINSKLIE
jgi:hypothetical protein